MATWVLTYQSLARQAIGHPRLRFPRRGASRPSPRRTSRSVLYLPIATADRTIGVLEVSRPGQDRFDDADVHLLTAFANQAALALERARLTEEAGRAAVLEQSDALKTALLMAVSHELRTPLATIKASVTSLLDETVAWDERSRIDFLQAVDEETDRLTLMVGKLARPLPHRGWRAAAGSPSGTTSRSWLPMSPRGWPRSLAITRSRWTWIRTSRWPTSITSRWRRS